MCILKKRDMGANVINQYKASSLRVTCLFTGQHKTNGYDTITDET